MANMSMRQQFLILVVVVIGSFYGYLHFVHDPMTARLIAAAKKNNALVKDVEALDVEPVNEGEVRRSMKPLEEELATLREEVKELVAARLAGPDDKQQVVYVVNETARGNYVTIKKFEPVSPDKLPRLPPEEVQEYKRLNRDFYLVSCSGDFVDFYSFVSELCQIERLVNIAGLVIARSKDTDGHVEVEFVLVI